jgi:hypothetical protein
MKVNGVESIVPSQNVQSVLRRFHLRNYVKHHVNTLFIRSVSPGGIERVQIRAPCVDTNYSL